MNGLAIGYGQSFAAAGLAFTAFALAANRALQRRADRLPPSVVVPSAEP